MVKRKNILVVAAHPDDEVLGCGGTIVKHGDRGDDVYVVALADGVTARFYQPGAAVRTTAKMCQKQINRRRNEFFRAAKIMGVKKENCHWLGLPDQRLDAVPLLDIVKPIEEISGRIVPDVVYTHHYGDLNKDHRICYEAVQTAFRPSRRTASKPMLYFFEILGNMDVLLPKMAFSFKPDYFVDVSAFIKTKLAALKAYRSEAVLIENVSCRTASLGREAFVKYGSKKNAN